MPGSSRNELWGYQLIGRVANQHFSEESATYVAAIGEYMDCFYYWKILLTVNGHVWASITESLMAQHLSKVMWWTHRWNFFCLQQHLNITWELPKVTWVFATLNVSKMKPNHSQSSLSQGINQAAPPFYTCVLCPAGKGHSSSKNPRPRHLHYDYSLVLRYASRWRDLALFPFYLILILRGATATQHQLTS